MTLNKGAQSAFHHSYMMTTVVAKRSALSSLLCDVENKQVKRTQELLVQRINSTAHIHASGLHVDLSSHASSRRISLHVAFTVRHRHSPSHPHFQ